MGPEDVRAAVDEFTKRLQFEFNTAIEDRATELLMQGYTVLEMSLVVEPGGKTTLAVNGIADSEFWIGHEGGSVTVNGRSVHRPKTADALED